MTDPWTTYHRSVREIPLDEEPHASVIAALVPGPGESPSALTDDQAAHLAYCEQCQAVTGTHLNGSSGELGDGAVSL
jgi:hypothetical protein